MKSQTIRKMLVIPAMGVCLAGCFNTGTNNESGGADTGPVNTDNEFGSVDTDSGSVDTDSGPVDTDNESGSVDIDTVPVDTDDGSGSVDTDSGSVDTDDGPGSDNQGVEASNPGVKGKIQKGPFQVGAVVTIQELGDTLVPNGTSYSVYTTDNLGSFALAAEIESDIIEIITQGYYFNEVSGKVTDATLALRSLSKPGDTVNVNLLTTLIEARIRALVADGGTFDEAREQAQGELLEVLELIGVNDDFGDFTDMDLSGNSDADAVLIAASAVFQGDHSTSELSALITNVALDATDGVVDDEVIIETLLTNSRDLDLAAVRSNLEGYFDGITIPTFEDYVDGDGDGSVNRDDSTCSYSPENAAYNQDILVLDAGDGDLSFAESYVYTDTLFLTADYTGTVMDADASVLVTEPGANTVLGSIDRSTLFVAAGTLTADYIFRSTIYVRDGASVTIDYLASSTLYVEDGGSVTIGVMSSSKAYAYSGASVTQTGNSPVVETCVADAVDPYDPSGECGSSTGYSSSNWSSTVIYESGASVSVATATASISTTMGDFPVGNALYLTTAFETSALNLDVTAFSCVNGYESTTESASAGESYFIEHGGALTLTDATNATVAVQSGGTLTISGGSGHVVYAQLEATVVLSGSVSDVTVYYESGVFDQYFIVDDDYASATVTLSADMTGTGNVVEAVHAVLLY